MTDRDSGGTPWDGEGVGDLPRPEAVDPFTFFRRTHPYLSRGRELWDRSVVVPGSGHWG